MELNYKLSEEEFVRVQISRHTVALRIQSALGYFFVLLYLLVLFMPTIHNRSAWLLLPFGIYLLCDRYLLAPYRLRRLFRRSPMISCERRVSINPDGITTVLPDATEDMRWSAFQRVDESNGNFLLFYAPRSYYVIPKRTFTTGSLEEFRSLLLEKGLL